MKNYFKMGSPQSSNLVMRDVSWIHPPVISPKCRFQGASAVGCKGSCRYPQRGLMVKIGHATFEPDTHKFSTRYFLTSWPCKPQDAGEKNRAQTFRNDVRKKSNSLRKPLPQGGFFMILPAGDDVAHQGRIKAHAPKPMGRDSENDWELFIFPGRIEECGKICVYKYIYIYIYIYIYGSDFIEKKIETSTVIMP